VEGRGRPEVLEWDRLQRIDTEEQKHSDGGYIRGDVGDALEEFEAHSLPAGGHFTPDEFACDVYGKPRLCDSRVVAFLRQHMQILNSAIQHVDGMDHSQNANVRYFHLDRAASEIFGRQTDHA